MALLNQLPPLLVYVVVAVLVATESAVVAGLVLPAATALIALGLLANAGAVQIVPALVVALVAAIAGGTVAYHSGRRRGSRVRETRLGRWIGEKRWSRAERLFARHGGRAVFLGQWVVGARTLVPRLAGMNSVPYRRFAAWHTPAAALWALWMVGASYLAGASYDLVAARAGRAGGALAAFSVLIAALVLAGRRFDLMAPSTSAWKNLGLSVTALFALAVALVLAIPAVVRLSGLAGADTAITNWARSEWTSDGYLFALDTITSADPTPLIAVAVVVSLVLWWLRRRRGSPVRLLAAIGPVLPMIVLGATLALVMPPDWHRWQEPTSVVFPAVTEFDGYIPFETASVMATVSAGHTAQLTAAAGLLAWVLAGHLSRRWWIVVWVAATGYAVVCAGSWVYLGWSRTSETVAAVLIGAAWTTLNAAIWSGPRKTVPKPDGTPATDSAPQPTALPQPTGHAGPNRLRVG